MACDLLGVMKFNTLPLLFFSLFLRFRFNYSYFVHIVNDIFFNKSFSSKLHCTTGHNVTAGVGKDVNYKLFRNYGSQLHTHTHTYFLLEDRRNLSRKDSGRREGEKEGEVAVLPGLSFVLPPPFLLLLLLPYSSSASFPSFLYASNNTAL